MADVADEALTVYARSLGLLAEEARP